jgi:DNA-binding MarR family transcriptional regulator
MKQRRTLLRRLIAAQTELRHRFQAAVPQSLQDEFAEFGGITVHQMEVVRRLLLGEGMTMSDVAAAQGIGPSGATQLVDRLERRGLVARVRDERDRRVQHVVPTDRARAITRRFETGISRAAKQVLEVLDDHELEIYVELTERIARVSRANSTESTRGAAA